jgi:hypothetical protein
LCQLEDVARVQNPVKIRVVFSANEFVIISNRDQETQTKPETSEEILESSDASSVAVLKIISTPCTLYSCLCVYFHMVFVFYKTVITLFTLFASIIHICSAKSLRI